MKFLLAATCAALMIGSATSAATIVQNGSFEDGNLALNSAGWGTFSTLAGGWTSGPGGIEVQTNPTLGQIDAQAGSRYVELDTNGNSYVEQAITLVTNVTYRLSFWYAPRSNDAATDGISYAILGAGVSGTVNAPITNAVDGWMLVSRVFLATAASNTLRFDATTRSDSFGGLVDNISIAAVPTPAAGLMLLGALGGLFAMRRRKEIAAV